MARKGPRKNRGLHSKNAQKGRAPVAPQLPAWITAVKSRADVTDDIVQQAMGLNSKPCENEKNHRNCVNNPNCLYGLGESDGLNWNKGGELSQLQGQVRDMANPNSFVGLKNLGATCYMNSLVQTLFSIPRFRQGVYKWIPTDSAPAPQDKAVKNLQMLFAHLQLGAQKVYIPTDFTDSLGIRTNVQQDAEEFYKLLLTMMEERFKTCDDREVQHIVQQTFQGKSAYQTVCSECKNASVRPTVFYTLELPIKDIPNLAASFASYLAEEDLVGDNQYKCEPCDRLVDAKRSVVLLSFPEVLTLQLMRFMYNPVSNIKQKALYVFNFPFRIDLAPYLKERPAEPTETEYELTAVVVHIGASANSGHYVAHVRNLEGQWFRFNDATVTPMDAKDVGQESDTELSKKGKQKMAERNEGTCNSANAYLLFYTRRDLLVPMTPQPTPAVTEALARFNEDTVGVIGALQKDKVDTEERIVVHKQLYRDIFQRIHPAPTEKGFFICKDWLARWVRRAGMEDLPPIDNSPIVCPHNGVNPRTLAMVKRVSTEGWSMLHAAHGGGPELTPMNICRECLTNMCLERTTVMDYGKRKAEVNKRLDNNPPNAGYWISKAWLSAWRAAENAELLSPDINEDIICDHGNLCTDARLRRIVDVEMWSYFSSLVEFEDEGFSTATTEVCPECVAGAAEQRAIMASRREERAETRKFFGSVYSTASKTVNKSREPPDPGSGKYAVVPRPWLIEWAAWVNEPEIESVVPMNTNSLLCVMHSRLLYDPSRPIFSDDTEAEIYAVIEEDAARLLIEKHGGDPIILFYPAKGAGNVEPFISPPPCRECISARNEQERLDSITFTDQEINITYVRQERKILNRKQKQKRRNQFAALGEPDVEEYTTLETNKKITVSSSMDLHTVRLLVFQAYDLLPVQQRLTYKDVVLEGESTSLFTFGVVKGSTLMLEKIADVDLSEADKMHIALEGRAKDNGGFYGSALVGGGDADHSFSEQNWACTNCKFEANSGTSDECASCGWWVCGRCTFATAKGVGKCGACETAR